jgi:NAD(P)-dependent dehydrogenase (short-subunit alcohol dehydrogenase family)
MKTVVISGATRGLGRALSRRFAESGWTVYGCGTDRNLVALANREFGAPHDFRQVDVADFEQVQDWAKVVVTRTGAPDLVIANAAVIHAPVPAWEVSADEFHRGITVNLGGVFHVAKAFMPALLKKGAGCLISVSSSWGREAARGFAAHCSTKFGVEGFTQGLALDVPPTIKVHTLDPGGGINTDLLRKCLPDEYTEYPSPETWAVRAFEYIVNELPAEPNGKPLTVPFEATGA